MNLLLQYLGIKPAKVMATRTRGAEVGASVSGRMPNRLDDDNKVSAASLPSLLRNQITGGEWKE